MRQDIPYLSPELLDVVLIDGEQAAAIGSMSISWWLAEVAAGRAPQPAIRRPRCTRWRFCAVAEFWRRFADEGHDEDRAQRLLTNAAKASAAAQQTRSSKLVRK
jgi:hypothetical protein